MTDLERYELVNMCESLGELSNAVMIISDSNNEIRGRNQTFKADVVARNCRDFSAVHPELLTRSFGIRQQAMYINHYTNGFPIIRTYDRIGAKKQQL